MVNEKLQQELKKEVAMAGGVVALASKLGINRGHVSLAYNGHRITPKLRLAMGWPNLKPAQTCACGEVHTVPWCPKEKGAPIPETEKEIVLVDRPRKSNPPERRRHRSHYEHGRGAAGEAHKNALQAEQEAAGCESFTEYVDWLRTQAAGRRG